MMKSLLIVALLAVVATSAIAQMDVSQGGYYQQQPWQVQMSPCREFLTQQCSPLAAAVPSLRSGMWQVSSCQVMRRQCCRQLAQIPEQSRCQAIYNTAHAVAQQQCQLGGLCGPEQQQAQLEVALQTLPAMCSVYVPPYCSAAAATSCAGGACY